MFLFENYTLTNKTLLSLCFVLLGINTFISLIVKKGNIAFGIILLIGIIFAFIGDVNLEIEFASSMFYAKQKNAN